MFTKIDIHANRVNSLRYEAENRYIDCLNIEPQTHCSLVEIEETAMEAQQNIKAWVTGMIKIYYYFIYSNITVINIQPKYFN